jgi:undecaprenyl-diphosphatase
MSIFSFLAENFDLPILDWIADNLWCPVLDAVMPVITLLGDAGIFWIAIAVALLFFKKTRRVGVGMGIALLAGLVLCNLTLKPLCQRPRPYDYQLDVFGRLIPLLIERQHDFAFPSGHTIASFEGAVALLIHDRKLGIPALVLAVLIAFSRLYLYVHYPTDVLASIILGVGFAFLGSFIVKKGFQLWEKRKTAS